MIIAFGAVPATVIVVGVTALTLTIMVVAPHQFGLSIIPLLLALLCGFFGTWSLWWSAFHRGGLPGRHKLGLVVGIIAMLAVCGAAIFEHPPIGLVLTLIFCAPVFVSLNRLLESSQESVHA